ncbi:MAG: hypothetical protein EAZ24_05265 [Burkholderiales bacterium]|nr:MAG: hypothetical protein EAZ24_05265 [Burkholderiales bacterium]
MFHPIDVTLYALREFHKDALHFLEAESNGYLERVSVHRESRTGERLYDNVPILGGLTLKGMREIGVA